MIKRGSQQQYNNNSSYLIYTALPLVRRSVLCPLFRLLYYVTFIRPLAFCSLSRLLALYGSLWADDAGTSVV